MFGTPPSSASQRARTPRAMWRLLQLRLLALAACLVALGACEEGEEDTWGLKAPELDPGPPEQGLG